MKILLTLSWILLFWYGFVTGSNMTHECIKTNNAYTICQLTK